MFSYLKYTLIFNSVKFDVWERGRSDGLFSYLFTSYGNQSDLTMITMDRSFAISKSKAKLTLNNRARSTSFRSTRLLLHLDEEFKKNSNIGLGGFYIPWFPTSKCFSTHQILQILDLNRSLGYQEYAFMFAIYLNSTSILYYWR